MDAPQRTRHTSLSLTHECKAALILNVQKKGLFPFATQDIEEEELPMQPISNPEETPSLVSYVEKNELTSDDDWLSDEEDESVEELKFNFTYISRDCTTFDGKKAEKEVEMTFERSNELQEKSKEDKPMMLLKVPPVSCILV
ncbi:hypothetical protein Scep_001831 [Stephania cephalantha]|uniref:Uncharacterized protein n=1 Tax=Stephania cephalantha TaxID=152367 RepID=A0AAP0L9U3_9MAGN